MFYLSQGTKLMLLGTADAVPVAPKSMPVFVEDMPEKAQATAVMASPASVFTPFLCCHLKCIAPLLPMQCSSMCALQHYLVMRFVPCMRTPQKYFSAGLENLGNTCYRENNEYGSRAYACRLD